MIKAIPAKTVLYFLAILVGGWSADAAEVTLRSLSHAKGSLVMLGDVADVKSTDAERVAQLKQVELFAAPPQQRSKLMHVRELVELLVLHGVDIEDLEFNGAQKTRIYAAAQESKAVATELPTSHVDASNVIVVASRALNRGDVVREADVELQPIDPKANDLQVATERQAVVGMEVLAPVREGQAISVLQLRKPLLVKRGEAIRVRARAAGVQVTVTARATEDGALGDVILMESLENREKYSAHVTGYQQVEVYATGIAAGEPARPTAERPSLLTEKQ